MKMQPSDSPLYFIVGCPRSGTYLLSSILNASGRIAIPTETHFVPLFRPHLWLAGDLHRPAARRRLMRAIFIFLRVWLARAEEERNFAAVSRHSLLAIESEATDIATASSGYAEIVIRLFEAYARQKGAPVCGDKSAFFDHIPLDQIDSAVAGSARFIHVVRDGRDVCLSWRRIKVGPRSATEAATAWRGHVEGKKQWGLSHPDRFLEIRYEDLLQNPRVTLSKIGEFIGFEFTEELLSFHTAPYSQDIANSSTHSRLGMPLDRWNFGKWRDELSPEDVLTFEQHAGRVLTDFGYALTHGENTNKPSVRRRRFSAHRVRLALKGLLPACALCAASVHFPLDRICNSRLWLKTESWLAKNRSAPVENQV